MDAMVTGVVAILFAVMGGLIALIKWKKIGKIALNAGSSGIAIIQLKDLMNT